MAPLRESLQFGDTASVNSEEDIAHRKHQKEHLYWMLPLSTTCSPRWKKNQLHYFKLSWEWFALSLFRIWGMYLGKSPKKIWLYQNIFYLLFLSLKYIWKYIMIQMSNISTVHSSVSKQQQLGGNVTIPGSGALRTATDSQLHFFRSLKYKKTERSWSFK